MNAEPISDEVDDRRGFWLRMRDGLFGAEELDDEADAGTDAPRKSSAPLRLQPVRSGRVAVRLNAQIFEDARLAADGLKGGEHQLVNLERATPAMAERITDFLNGVCYALDGTVERVGERVYAYLPANVTVEVDSGAKASTQRAYDRG